MTNETQQPGQIRAVIRNVAVMFLWLSMLFGFALTVLGFFPSIHWTFELLSHLRLNVIWGSLPILLLALVLRRWWIVVLAVITCVINLMIIAPVWRTPHQPLRAKTTSTVCVANVLTSNTQYELFQRVIRKQRPDVVLLVEVGDAWTQALKPLHAKYPHRFYQPRNDNFGLAVLSKHPLTQSRRMKLGTYAMPAFQASVTLPQSDPLTLYLIHPIPPTSPRNVVGRDTYLSELTEKINAQDGAKLVAGDFNATPWSEVFESFTKQTKLRDTRVGQGMQSTWPAMIPTPFQIPIDHILVSDDVALYKRWVTAPVGSDHLPVCVEIHVGREHRR